MRLQIIIAGQCSDCHSTGGWGSAGFNHNGQTNCISCHSGDAPAKHYPGQCSNCHNPGLGMGECDLQSFRFYTTVASCHSSRFTTRITYPGQCSNCHDRPMDGQVQDLVIMGIQIVLPATRAMLLRATIQDNVQIAILPMDGREQSSIIADIQIVFRAMGVTHLQVIIPDNALTATIRMVGQERHLTIVG